uniref:ubiquitinyl hydrolase 1 n=1 Tax=Strombidinopsis acuminata TaxID=141414 RepID=A0A7S3TEM5_9SPIT|mmetsp:Transcript_63638/g.87864  ORF Transcript_63638/g.87864 Transcript_63638/m.87864 type:complete len:303 (+) Transcript_63638:2-910(+)
MQLLSHCAQSDPERPFYTGMVRLCKEFHSRKSDANDLCNVLQLPQVKEIISTWQSIGAQQDAGEFLFYMLNGMHDECKWRSKSSSSSAPASKNGEDGDADKDERKAVEVRSGSVDEDSPVVRIFGGQVRSSVRSKSGDSVSFEPFNHLILDISSPTVDSVWAALETYCGQEAVDEGRATKQLQFKLLPKVLILNLKRFSYNTDTGCPQKVKKAIAYEEKLTFDRSWLVDGVEPAEYQLTAVIWHHGDSANGGHYNAAARYNSEWYMYDDALVRQTEIREVMYQQLTAYILFYQCQGKVDMKP